MEDFARELNAQGGLYLIHGVEGVGKTRLLVELAASRLAERKIRWMDLQAGNSGDGVLVDSSVLIEKTFARASPGDVIIADHFEMALKKTRHQLFLSWSTDGTDKILTLVIATNSDYYGELKQLAQQYQVRVESFQQMPFSPEEATAFLGFYLYPDRPVGELVIPPLLRDQLEKAQGNVGKIIEIAERAGDQISSAPISDSKEIPRRSGKLIGAVAVAVLLLGVGWFYLGNQEGGPVPPPEPVVQLPAESDPVSAQTEPDSMPVAGASSETMEVVEDVTAADLVAEAVVEPEAMQANESAASEAEDAPPQEEPATSAGVDAEIDKEEAIEAHAEGADTSPAVAEPPAQPDEQPAETLADASESDSNVVGVETATETASAGSDEVEPADWGSARLRRDLQSSLEWINARESRTGTLQIMLLSQARFDERLYYEHLAQLASQGVDVSRIRIFESYTANKPVLSVVYGEYPSRAAANGAKPDLPPILRKIGPVARSVGGLRVEIERLGEQN
jgi:septal ring-binding cell division protein DamX